ncbi:uncharacterized protein VTP21DRAFT_5578 [Calcarisporiella thermophila]|uniref:uncharacterized protein n=1 Tax=Calcarisporiella thermophila TaxID=911321 RepID=UPI0037432E9A
MRVAKFILLTLAAVSAAAAQAQPEQESTKAAGSFDFFEASISDLQKALDSKVITSMQLVDYYYRRIRKYDRKYHSISDVNPNLYRIARQLDEERRVKGPRGPLHGIPILLKDNIATGDGMHNTAGSLALFDNRCLPKRDSAIAERLRKAGAIILGKACLSEWANFRTLDGSKARYGDPDGWSGRCGQVANAYNLDESPSGSSSGSAVAVAADFVTVSLGSDTDASIVAPASRNALVGLRPTVGLTPRDLVIPIAHSFDTVGPMAKSVEDAAIVMEVIAGFDRRDVPANLDKPDGFKVPKYTKFLDKNGLKGARIGVPRHVYYDRYNRPEEKEVVEKMLKKLEELGATIVDPADIPTADELADMEPYGFGYELTAFLHEFKHDVAAYLSQLPAKCPMKTLKDLIKFNEEHAKQEMPLFKQEMFEAAQNTTGLDAPAYKDSLKKVRELAGKKGIDAVMDKLNLDALVQPVDLKLLPPQPSAAAGYPMITVPIGFDDKGVPFALGFVGRAYSEPTLFKFAYAFEQATKARKPPKLKA